LGEKRNGKKKGGAGFRPPPLAFMLLYGQVAAIAAL